MHIQDTTCVYMTQTSEALYNQQHWKGSHRGSCDHSWVHGTHTLCTERCSAGSQWTTHRPVLHTQMQKALPDLEGSTQPQSRPGFIFGSQVSHIHWDLNWPDSISGLSLELTPRGGLQGQGNLVSTITNNPEQAAVWLVWGMQNSHLRKCGRDLKIFRYLKC